ncbi:hypothetical protein V1264_012607 [Littorina saxatilis]|uniref:Uncharacterized protein n=1 Tax=Littorina saxatilis TaxID=31220 RepID=A0AAN9BXZ2_9CAEN
MVTMGTQTSVTVLKKGVVFAELSDDDLNGGVKQLRRNLFKKSVFESDKKCMYMLGHKFQPPLPRIWFPVPDS